VRALWSLWACVIIAISCEPPLETQFFSVHCNWGILPPSYERDVPDSHGRKASVHAAGERQTAAEP
jgi:hypothetical protein